MPQLLESDEGLVVLASDYGALGKKQELSGLVAPWQKLPEQSDDAALDFATTMMSYGMRAEATAVLEQEEKRVASRPQSEAALRLASAFATLGVLDHAESNAQLALSFDPQCAACYQALAQIAERQNNSEKALSCLVKAKQMAPQVFAATNSVAEGVCDLNHS